MTDRELLELIAAQVGSLTNNMDNLTKDVSNLKEGQNKIENEIGKFRQETIDRFDRIENKLDDMEVNNADRHILIGSDIKKIKAGLSKIEIITADNWGDIARLKAMRKHKIK